jgi:hypothetical protein
MMATSQGLPRWDLVVASGEVPSRIGKEEADAYRQKPTRVLERRPLVKANLLGNFSVAVEQTLIIGLSILRIRTV